MLAFVDPFIVSPAMNCLNEFVELMQMPVSYHMPDRMGLESLEIGRDKIKGYIVAGSASNVTEPLPWHKPLADFLLEELKKGKPVLGCCFGHQLLCHAFGSEVCDIYPDGKKIKGLREMVIQEDFRNLKKSEKFILPVTHRQYVKTLGNDLISLATGLDNDIVAHKKFPMLSTQGHPEASKYFCATDIGTLTPGEEATGREYGKKLIAQFFNTHLK